MVGFAMQEPAEPLSEHRQTTANLTPNRVLIIAVVVCPVLLTAIFIGAFLPSARPTAPVYKGKSLEAWFFGWRKGFFNESRQEAIDDLGTNAFPFLLSLLKHNRGNGVIYFKLYRAMPARVQARLPFPLSGDDIKAMSLHYIMRMHGVSTSQVEALADCVPTFGNPRVRMIGFYLMMHYQTDPAFLKMCKRLLDDNHPGIQLQAATYLAQSAIVSDPREPRLFPILLAALESKQQRKPSIELKSYTYHQQPPGIPGPSTRPMLPLPYGVADPDEVLQNEIRRALDRLERYMTEGQKNRYRQAEQTQNEKTGKI